MKSLLYLVAILVMSIQVAQAREVGFIISWKDYPNPDQHSIIVWCRVTEIQDKLVVVGQTPARNSSFKFTQRMSDTKPQTIRCRVQAKRSNGDVSDRSMPVELLVPLDAVIRPEGLKIKVS